MAEKNIEIRTMSIVLDEIKENISAFNATVEPSVKVDLEVSLKALEREYNELSLLNSWGEFVKAENPMVAFAQAYTYPIIGHKDVDHRETIDGVKKVTRTRKIEYDKTRILNVAEFVEWNEERNIQVTNGTGWRKSVNEARDAVIAQWKAFMNAKGDTRLVSIGKMKRALQSMVDALVFVAGEKGGNAYVVKGNIAKAVFALSNTRKDGLIGAVMPKSVWQKLQMDVLHAVVADKEFTINYGEEDEESIEIVPATEAVADAATEESK